MVLSPNLHGSVHRDSDKGIHIPDFSRMLLSVRLSEQNLGVIDYFCDEGFSVEIGLLGTDHAAIGIQGMQGMYEECYAAFPDLRQELVEMSSRVPSWNTG